MRGESTGPDLDWIRRCLSIAQMDDDLARMPDGLDTEIGRKGTLVSGGQKQRVAIARALAGRPDLLLLDDCTASLDARNEDRFWAELRRETPDATVFLVSHRLATIRRADKILVLDAGRQVGLGAHDELAETCGTYQEFLQTEARRAHLGGGAASLAGRGRSIHRACAARDARRIDRPRPQAKSRYPTSQVTPLSTTDSPIACDQARRVSTRYPTASSRITPSSAAGTDSTPFQTTSVRSGCERRLRSGVSTRSRLHAPGVSTRARAVSIAIVPRSAAA